MADETEEDLADLKEVLDDLRSDDMNARLRAVLKLDARRNKRADIGARIFEDQKTADERKKSAKS